MIDTLYIDNINLLINYGIYSSIGRMLDCGSRGCRFKSCFIPVFKSNYYILKRWNTFFFNVSNLFSEINTNLLYKINFLDRYYFFNDFIWQEAFLVDFLQKKIVNKWVYKFLIVSSYLFNERLIFETLINFLLAYFIWPSHKIFFFDVNNILNLLLFTFFIFLIIILLVFLFYLTSFIF